MAGNRLRHVDWTIYRHFTDSSATAQAAEEIISTPDKHLLTQDQLFEAEGGFAGVAVQAATVGLGLATLFSVRPRLFTYLKNAQLRSNEWLQIGGATLFSYHIGYEIAARTSGDAQKVQNHWMAYYFVKQNNRFEGR